MRVLDDKTKRSESGKIMGVEFSGVAMVTTTGGLDGSVYGEV
ncbi:MAG TPA: hypothetical protein VE548_04585 [Nitrososphaeraceae archaeon]|jgi:hypothetical protein|nr:hypothetical protein [Nitrososphaeraceae archaeon]